MSQNAIGRAALILTTKSDQLNAGLNKSAGDISDWGGRIRQTVGSAMAGVNASAAAGANTIAGRMLPATTQVTASLGGMTGALSGTIGLIGRLGPWGMAIAAGLAVVTAAAIAAGVAFHSLNENARKLSEMGRTASSLGMRSAQFMGLAASASKAGVAEQEFGALVGKMTAKIASGGSDVAEALQSIGLTVQQLRGQSPDQQFLTIADALAKVPNAGQRAASAMKLFEEQGLKLLPMLSQGKAGIEEQIKSAQKLGLAFNEKQLAAVERSRAAVDRVGTSFAGMWNKVTVAAAPFLELIANKLADGLDWINQKFDVILPAVEQTFRLMAIAAANTFDSMVFGVGAVQSAVGALVQAVAKAGAAMNEGLFKLIPANMLPAPLQAIALGASAVNKSIADTGDAMMSAGLAKMNSFGSTAAMVDGWFAQVNRKGDEALAKAEQAAKVIQSATVPSIGFTDNKALIGGTAEALNAQFRHELGGGSNIPNQQLVEAKKTNEILTKMAQKPATSGELKVTE